MCCTYFVSAPFFMLVCAFMSVSECEKGEEMTGSQVEPPVADSTPFSFYYQITRDKQLWQSAKVRPAGKELWWKRRRSPRCGKHRIINATRVCHSKCHPYMTQSSVCHFQIWQGGRCPPPSLPADPRHHMKTLLHLSDCKKKMLGDNTINTDCDLWSNVFWEASQPW